MFITHDFTIKKDNCESLNNLARSHKLIYMQSTLENLAKKHL